MDYSLKQCKDDMCQMWKWLYENPTKKKDDFIKAHPNFAALQGGCAACEYDNQTGSCCNCCPVNWPLDNDGDLDCTHESSPFTKWKRSKTLRPRSIHAKEVYKLALQIKV